MKPPPIVFDAHQPERRRRSSVTLCGCTCCTCCCCLHTIGSLIGAAVAPTIGAGQRPSLSSYYEDEDIFPLPRARTSTGMGRGTGITTSDPDAGIGQRPTVPDYEEDEDRPSLTRPAVKGISAVALFWWVLLIAAVLTMFISVSMGAEGLLIGLLVVAVFLPLGQMGSALVVSIALLISRQTDKSYQFRQLGKITLGVILGCVVGIGLMFGIGSLLFR